MDPPELDIPPLKDLTTDNITENTICINSQCPDPRMKYVLERLVSHLHQFARETRLSNKEWVAGYEFLTAVGHICSDVRQVSHFPNDKHPIVLSNVDRNTIVQQLPDNSSKLTSLLGIHLALRCPWSLTPCRLHRPPKTSTCH